MFDFLLLIIFVGWIYKSYLNAKVRQAQILADMQADIIRAQEETKRLELLQKSME